MEVASLKNMPRDTRVSWKTLLITWGVFLLIVLYLAAKAGMAFHHARADPSRFWAACTDEILAVGHFEYSEDVLAFALFGLLAWGLVATTTFRSTGRFREGAEYGAASWGNAARLRRQWEDRRIRKAPDGTLIEDPNIILSRQLRLGTRNMQQTRKNKNVLVVGGSGTRKSTGLVMPNIMQCNSSFVVTDPSGELYAGLGRLLEERGYTVKCLNLVDMSRSHGTNPFHYITRPEHVGTLATAFIRNTRTAGCGGGDPFWDNAMQLLLMALVAYIWEFEPRPTQNFATLTEMVRAGRLDKDEMGAKSDLDKVFEDIGRTHPDSLAWKNYLRATCSRFNSAKSGRRRTGADRSCSARTRRTDARKSGMMGQRPETLSLRLRQAA